MHNLKRGGVWLSAALFAWVSININAFANTDASAEANTGTKIDTVVNVQGFSGLINVPTGQVINFGELHWNYSNLTDVGSYSNGTSNGLYQKGNNLSLTASPFPGLEATIRNTGGDFEVGSDLSANIKYQATFIPQEWFSFAVGYQDIGGITNHLDSYFATASKDWGDFRFTAGIGSFNSERSRIARRYEGGFYGVQYQPFEWLQLQAENDGVNNAVALQFKTPAAWLDNQAQIYGSFITGDYAAGDGNDKHFFQVGLKMNLSQGTNAGLNQQSYQAQQINDDFSWLMANSSASGTEVAPLSIIDFMAAPHYESKLVAVTQLKQRLADHGFEDVWVGQRGTELLVRIENSIYNRNQIDAIGVVMGMVAEATHDTPESHFTHVDFTLSRYQIPTLRLRSALTQLRGFYTGELNQPHFVALVPQDKEDVLADWIGGVNQPWFTPRVKFSPVVPNFIGTEIGQADVNFSVRANVHVPLWKGAEAYAEYDVNISRSKDFQRGGSFWKYGQKTGLKNVFVRQTWQLPYNIYVAGGLGVSKQQYLEEHNVATFQAGWQSLNGRHRMSYHYGYLDSRIPEGKNRYIYTLQYRHYIPKLNVSMYAEGGQFWYGDRGYSLGFTTYIGDSLLSVYTSETDRSMYGLSFTIPMGSRKNMAPSQHGYQFRLAERWTYALATSSYKGTNQISVNRAYRPGYLGQLQGRYFNFDRLSLAYINENLPRLRQAFKEFTQ